MLCHLITHLNRRVILAMRWVVTTLSITRSEKVELLSNYRGFPSLSKINRKWKCEFSIEAKSIEKVNFHLKTHFMCLYTISILQIVITMPHFRSPLEVIPLTLPTNEIWNSFYINFGGTFLIYIDFRQGLKSSIN